MEIKKNFLNNVVKISKTKGKCPTCRKNVIETFAPFCSKRCSDTDLMKWLSDKYMKY